MNVLMRKQGLKYVEGVQRDSQTLQAVISSDSLEMGVGLGGGQGQTTLSPEHKKTMKANVTKNKVTTWSKGEEGRLPF